MELRAVVTSRSLFTIANYLLIDLSDEWRSTSWREEIT